MSSKQPDQEPIGAAARGEDSTGRTGRAGSRDLPASLLKRVAEAAAGSRDGRRVWFVAERAFPHRLEAFHDEGEADAAEDESGGSKVKVGPCLTPDEHAGRKRIEWIKVKIEGREKPVEFQPSEVDALFFSHSACEKFLYPYYTALYGPEEAAKMYRHYETAPMVCHMPSSEPCTNGTGDAS